MAQETEISFRKYLAADRAALRQIVYDTALMGESAGIFFAGQEVITDALSLYFTDYEPDAAFVAEANGQIVAYLIGAKNKIHAEKTFNQRIILPLLFKAFKSGVLLKPKNIAFFLCCLKDFLINGIKTPNFTAEYPATFHLNVKAGFRGAGIGQRLIAIFLDYLKQEKVKGVHLATMSEAAGGFFLAQGFTRLYKGKRSYFRHILHRDVPLYIFGKLL
jgi:GNAT superfamily N-acetyltransferase